MVAYVSPQLVRSGQTQPPPKIDATLYIHALLTQILAAIGEVQQALTPSPAPSPASAPAS